jgi:hypothetical protein
MKEEIIGAPGVTRRDAMDSEILFGKRVCLQHLAFGYLFLGPYPALIATLTSN